MIQDTIKQRLRASLLASASHKTALDTAAHLSAEQNDEGSWNDLDSKDESSHAPPKAGHLQRTLLLARAHHLAPADLGGPLRRALDWWLARDPRDPDPYQDAISIPRLVGEIALLCDDELSLGAVGKVSEILTRSRWAYWEPSEGWTEWNGVVLLGVAYNVLLRGCLEKSPFLCDTAFRRVFRHVRWTLPNAAEVPAHLEKKPDSPLIVDGVSLTQDYCRLIALAYGTPWQAPVETTRAFVSYLLDYQQWTVRQSPPDVTTRSALAPGPNWPAVAEGIMQLAQLGNPPRRLELVAVAERFQGLGKPLSGHRLFRRLQLAVHHRPAFYACLRLGLPVRFHQEAAPSEAPAMEGTLYLLRDGREYERMDQRWNYQQLPGLTAIQNPSALHPEPSGPAMQMVGGLGEGDYGLAARELSGSGLRGRKSWFFLDASVVCLDAGLHGPPVSQPVFTTLNQCRLRGPVVVEGTGRQRHSLTPGIAHDLINVRRVWHDGLLYHFPGSLHVGASIGPLPERRGELPVTGEDVFSLWIDHGLKPAGAASAYVVIASDSHGPDSTANDREAAQVEILANTAAVQAVRHRGAGILSIVFWEPGVVTLPEGGRVAANRPCLMLCREGAPGPTLSLTNMVRSSATVHVEYHGRCLAFELPGDADIGRTVSQRL